MADVSIALLKSACSRRGKKPQARTLRRMVEAGFLDAETAAAAVDDPIELGTEATDDGTYGPWRAPYFVSEVRANVS